MDFTWKCLGLELTIHLEVSTCPQALVLAKRPEACLKRMEFLGLGSMLLRRVWQRTLLPNMGLDPLQGADKLRMALLDLETTRSKAIQQRTPLLEVSLSPDDQTQHLSKDETLLAQELTALVFPTKCNLLAMASAQE
jgi:hypothetical protein